MAPCNACFSIAAKVSANQQNTQTCAKSRRQARLFAPLNALVLRPMQRSRVHRVFACKRVTKTVLSANLVPIAASAQQCRSVRCVVATRRRCPFRETTSYNMREITFYRVRFTCWLAEATVDHRQRFFETPPRADPVHRPTGHNSIHCKRRRRLLATNEWWNRSTAVRAPLPAVRPPTAQCIATVWCVTAGCGRRIKKPAR